MRVSLLLIILSLSSLACTRQQDQNSNSASLALTLPSQGILSQSTVKVYSAGSTHYYGSTSFSTKATLQNGIMTSSQTDTPFNPLLNPTALSGFDCFLVFVGGSDFSSEGQCTTTSGAVIPVGVSYGGVPAGSTINLSIPSGQRQIILVGFNAESSNYCADFKSGVPEDKLSEPYVLASQNVNLVPGNQSVTLNAAFSTTKIEDCYFSHGYGDSGGYYGNGADGDLTVGAGATINLSSQTSPTTGVPYFSVARVYGLTDMSSSYGAEAADVTLYGSQDWSTKVIVGDEIMLYVASEASSGCGGNVYPGYSSSGVVEALYSANHLRIRLHDSRFLTVSGASITASAADSTAHCRMLISRVPNFNNIYYSSAGTGTLEANNTQYLDLEETDHTAVGLLTFRVAGDLSMTGAGSLAVSVNGGGYVGAEYITGNDRGGGQGAAGFLSTVFGTSIGLLSNAGGTGTSGCGGGHGGSGGCTGGSNFGQPVGDNYGCADGIYEASMKCLMGKIFMGGGGGTISDNVSGGNGGGLIKSYINNITLSSTGNLDFNANGVAGNVSNAGGGAGGGIFVDAQSFTYTGSGALTANANGGAGGSTGPGGGGGGGRVHMRFNSVTGSPTITPSVLAGANGSTAATDGTCYVEGYTVSGCN